MSTIEEMRAHLIERCQADDTFRRQLVGDPRSAIYEELDLDVPEHFHIYVHEDTAKVMHMVLPLAAELSHDQARVVVAGWDPAKSLVEHAYD